MKAKELAALLLQNPEQEVYLEETNWNDWDCSVYYTPSAVLDITTTPDGVFIVHGGRDRENLDNLKIPSNKPIIGDLKIEYHDGNNLLCLFIEENSHVQEFFENLLNDGYVTEYNYANNNFRFTEDTNSPNYSTEDDCYIVTPNDVTISVLTSYDEDWNVTYTEMTYEEAKKYAYDNFEITDYREDE